MAHVPGFNRPTRSRTAVPVLLVLTLLFTASLAAVVAEPAEGRMWCGPKKTPCVADTTPPETTVTSGPSATGTSTSAVFEFVSNEAHSTFQCRLDGSTWLACSSPRSYTELTAMSHLFEVRAIDSAGNADASPAAWSFTVTTSTVEAGTKATTRPVGSAPLSDAEAAARVTRSSWEPRPGNYIPNHRVPTSTELATYRSLNTAPAAYRDKVTGNFTGTTDEIIQWAAHKWGIDEDIVRAQAVKESWWDMNTIGDGGISFGLMQIKSTVSLGTYPLSQLSTAFNVDYYGASLRYYFDGGATWLNDPCCFSGTTYVAGDIWGSVGAWFAGRWYTVAAVEYISSVKNYLAARTWAQPGF